MGIKNYDISDWTFDIRHTNYDIRWMHLDYSITSAPFVSELREF